MLDEQHLRGVIANITPISFSGTAYRYIKLKHFLRKIKESVIFDESVALSAIGSFKNGGRYNLKEVFEVLYLADNPQNALLEVRAIRETGTGLEGVPTSPYLSLSIKYNLENVIDLTDTATHQILGTNLIELKSSWGDLNADGINAPTQTLGKLLYDLENIEAIKVPSSYVNNAYNLNIFPDRLIGNSSVQVYDVEKFIESYLRSP